MTIDKEERETLHTILDSLISSRNYLETVDKESLKGAEYYWRWTYPRKELVRNGSVFLRKILGPNLHREELKILFSTELEENAVGAELAATIANSIRSFLPLFMEDGRYEGIDNGEVITKIIQDLTGIYWGDEPRFFSLWPRRQGLHKRPYRIARLRLQALDWDKFLTAAGVRAHERHHLISDAFRTDWEAIRKWSKSIEEQFDLVSHPPEDLEKARQEYLSDPESVVQNIWADGDAYWSERGSANPGKER